MPLGVDRLNHYVSYFKIWPLQEREEIFRFVGALDDVYVEITNQKFQEATKPK